MIFPDTSTYYRNSDYMSLMYVSTISCQKTTNITLQLCLLSLLVQFPAALDLISR